MKLLVLYGLLMFPVFAFGQLSPSVPEFNGRIEKVIEKRFGKEANFLWLFKRNYRSHVFSGWKYIYMFDQNRNLVRRTACFHGKVQTAYLYQRDTTGNRTIEREVIVSDKEGHDGDYLEYEYFKGGQGQIEKMNLWSFNAKECSRELSFVEKNAEYRNNKLVSFTRHPISQDGDTVSGENCKLFYDDSGRLARIERKDLSSGFTTSFNYFYNGNGFMVHYTVDFLMELQEDGKSQIQDIYYQYDRQGNWVKMSWKSGGKSRLEAKRKIKYYR